MNEISAAPQRGRHKRGHVLPPRAKRTGREAWIEAARSALISGGVAAVRIELLAKTLSLTTGSFYWHYKDRDDLFRELLKDWEITNSTALFRAAADAGDDPRAKMSAIVDVWIEERGYSPAYDAALRDWARISKAAETAVRRVDRKRIALLKQVFIALGYEQRRAFIRARITYFHQLGYYAMRINESREIRRRLKPLYIEALLGEAASD